MCIAIAGREGSDADATRHSNGVTTHGPDDSELAYNTQFGGELMNMRYCYECKKHRHCAANCCFHCGVKWENK